MTDERERLIAWAAGLEAPTLLAFAERIATADRYDFDGEVAEIRAALQTLLLSVPGDTQKP